MKCPNCGRENDSSVACAFCGHKFYGPDPFHELGNISPGENDVVDEQVNGWSAAKKQNIHKDTDRYAINDMQ